MNNVREIFEARRDGYTISTDPYRLDVVAIHAYLTRSYWVPGIPIAVVENAVRGSLGFGLYDAMGAQVGFTRAITDYATFAYLCDVYTLESVRGNGLGKWLVECVRAYPEFVNLRRMLLATADAHGLYSQFDFKPLRAPERFMEIVRPDIYKSGQS